MPSALRTGFAIAGAAGLVAGGAAYAALYPTSQIFGRVLISGRDPQQLALTYDDGPNPAITPQLLDLLAAHGVKATFFLIGRFVQQERRLATEIAGRGHLIGSHTMNHPRLALQSNARIHQELGDAKSLIEDVIGAPLRYFRPPHGERRPYVIRAARELGLATVQWNITAADWKPIGAHAIASNVQRGIARNRSKGVGSNILLHDGGHLGLGADRRSTLEATAHVLSEYPSSRFVTVDAWDNARASVRQS